MAGKEYDPRAAEGFERIADVARFCRLNPDDPDSALAAILDAAIHLTNADRGNIQLLESSGELVIASQRGFDEESLSCFARVDPETSTCGLVVRTGEQHIVEDIKRHDAYSGTEGLTVMLRAGVRAIQSTPLVSSAGTVVGMISTTFREPHRPTKAELAAVAVLAGVAADHLEHANARRSARWGSQTLEALLGILPIPAYVALDPDCRTVLPNAAAAAIFGTPTNENASQAAAEAGEAPSFPIYRDGKRLAAKDMPLERAVATGETERDVSLDVELPNGDRRSITGTASPLFDDDGEVRGAVGVFIDITALRKAEEAREQSAARLRLALRAAHAAIWQSDLVSGPVYGPEVNEIFGYPTDRVLTPDEVRSRHLPGELERSRRVVYADLSREERTEVEFRIRRLDGEVRWLLLRGELAPSVEGQPRTFVGVMMDITERKEAEERTKFLAREVDHRANNLLAVVQSVVQLSTAPTPEALKRVLLGRISALGRAHKLLSEARWRGADLRRLVTEELMAFTLGETARLSMTGQDVSLSPAIAQGLAMALHELATNASKYGALSSSTGRVDVSWSREGSALLTIRWIETGGPAVTPPTRQGLGGVMLSRALEGLKGETNMDWRPEGLVCEMSLPGEAVESEGLAD